MSYFPKGRRRALHDDSDPFVDGGDGTSISSSTTVQDTTVSASGATIGGQDSGVPSVPLSDWKNIGGVCYATNSTFLGALKGLQRQLNRICSVHGIKLLVIDGQIGTNTLAVLATVSQQAGFSSLMSNPDVSTCDAVCSSIQLMTSATQQYADSLGVSSSVSSPSPASTPVTYNQTTGALQPQGLADSAADVWGNMSSTMQYGLIAAAGLGGYLVYRETKKGKR